MKIIPLVTPKFCLGEEVYAIEGDKIVKLFVCKIEFFQEFDRVSNPYSFIHYFLCPNLTDWRTGSTAVSKYENQLFHTKEELIKSLE